MRLIKFYLIKAEKKNMISHFSKDSNNKHNNIKVNNKQHKININNKMKILKALCATKTKNMLIITIMTLTILQNKITNKTTNSKFIEINMVIYIMRESLIITVNKAMLISLI